MAWLIEFLNVIIIIMSKEDIIIDPVKIKEQIKEMSKQLDFLRGSLWLW